ncbi:MAG: hypothetical protein D6805_01695 [Planctomycetota bacterium]|nr:MAG: hypothetical protein D6805_01695 [Planctomycetota bacterium]
MGGEKMRIQGFRGSQEELQQRFSLSPRLQARIGALLAKKIEVSVAILETLEKSSIEEKLLLHPRLLKDGPSQEIFDEVSPDTFSLLEKEDGWKLICYDEEIQAQVGFQQTTSLSQVESFRPSISESSLGVSSLHFSEQELEKCKITILTSADSKAKIEALRKISLSPLKPNEKAMLVLHSISDSDSSFWQEAANCLAALGLCEEITECIKAFAQDDSARQVYSLERLGKMASTYSKTEATIAFHFLSKLLLQSQEPYMVVAIARTLQRIIPCVSQFQMLLDLAKSLIRLLPNRTDEYEQYFRDIFKMLIATFSSEQWKGFFHHELEATTDPSIRAFLLITMHQNALASPAFLADHLVGLMVKIKDTDPLCFKLAKAVVEIAQEAVKPLILHYKNASDGHKIFFIQLLDRIASRLSRDQGKILEDIGHFFLDLLEGESKFIQRAIYEAQFFKNTPSSLKKEVAQSFCSHLRDFLEPELYSHIELVFRALGVECVEPLMHKMEHTIEDSIRDLATQLLGVAGVGIGAEKGEALLQFLRKYLNTAYVDQGTLLISLARIASSSNLPSSYAKEFFDRFWTLLWQTEYDYSLLEAISILAASPHLSEDEREKTWELLQKLLTRRPPQEVKLYEDKNGVYHHREDDVEFFTDLIPSALESTKHLLLSEHVSFSLRERLLDFLLRISKEVSSWKIFWGPYNETRLVQMLADASLSSLIDHRRRSELLLQLRPHCTRVYILRTYKEVFEKYFDIPQLGEAAAAVALYLLKWKVENKKFYDDINQLAHETLAVIASHHHLGGGKYDPTRILEAVVQLLFEGIGHRLSHLDIYLRRIVESPLIPGQLRDKVQHKLQRLYAVRKAKEI